MSLHRLLERQLRRAGFAEPPDGDQRLDALLASVSRAYDDADRERYRVERSLALASAEMRDLYERMNAAHETRFAEIIDGANDAIFAVDLAGNFTLLNKAAERLGGYARGELVGQSFTKVVAPESLGLVMEALRSKRDSEAAPSRYEIEIITRSGTRVPLELSTRAIRVEGRDAEVVGIGRDVRERIERDRLEYLAHHDALTGLPNRYVLDDVVSNAAATAGAMADAFLLMIDLDNFKVVNDTVGHLAGDEVLTSISALLRSGLRSGDVLARLGGDEFAAVLFGCTEDSARAVAESLRGMLASADINAAGRSFSLGGSIGVVAIHQGDRPADVIARADTALYQAKHGGRNRVVLSNPGVQHPAPLQEAHRWVRRVRSALEDGRVVVHYQPVLDLSSGEVAHYEALVRAVDKDGQTQSAGQFVPHAEQWGLMPRIDQVVFDAVVKTLERDRTRRVFLNLSALSLSDAGLLFHIDSALAARPGVASRLGVEITETAVVRDFDAASRWMARLRRHGVRFALDDFGVGFSSLAYLRDLPFDQLKVDGSFVREMVNQPRLSGMVRAIKGLGDLIELETVAEGIESGRILEAVRQLGIRYGQGYFLGMPQLPREALGDAA